MLMHVDMDMHMHMHMHMHMPMPMPMPMPMHMHMRMYMDMYMCSRLPSAVIIASMAQGLYDLPLCSQVRSAQSHLPLGPPNAQVAAVGCAQEPFTGGLFVLFQKVRKATIHT